MQRMSTESREKIAFEKGVRLGIDALIIACVTIVILAVIYSPILKYEVILTLVPLILGALVTGIKAGQIILSKT